jgi:type IV pilus assembly protein PilM
MGLFGSNEITGIDIGSGSIKVVRIAPGRRPKLLSAGMMEFPLEGVRENVGADLLHLRSEKKIGVRNVVTQMPGKDLTIRTLTLPRMPAAELREAVRWEAKRHISYPLDAALVEYLIAGEKREGMVDKYDILMVAAEQEKIAGHLAPFREAGIKVSAVDGNALALRNVLRMRHKAAQGNHLVVDIGAGKTEIDIYKDGVLRFSRCLETGGAEMTRVLAESLNLSLRDAEALKQRTDVSAARGGDNAVVLICARLDGLLMEVRRSVEYYKTTFREPGVEDAVLSGGVALIRGASAYFSQALGFPVELDDPFDGLLCQDSLRVEFGPSAPRFSAAVGLALRKV